MPKAYMDKFWGRVGAHRTYRFQTQPDEVEWDNGVHNSDFQFEEDLELFEDWTNFPHSSNEASND